jgi:hypothetical protein
MTLQLISDNQTDINQIALEEFQEHRVELKKPMTPLAIKKAIKVLLPYSLEQQQYMVDQAILNGWRGLFPVREPIKISSRENSIEHDLHDTSWAH